MEKSQKNNSINLRIKKGLVMLINLSNHPSAKWGKNQKETAIKEYGEIVDLPFPQINPEVSEKSIKDLASEYFEKIKQTLGNTRDNNNAVHLMGELTFSFTLVNMLLDAEITCVASTTTRKTIEIGNKKMSEFEFVKFRKYVR